MIRRKIEPIQKNVKFHASPAALSTELSPSGVSDSLSSAFSIPKSGFSLNQSGPSSFPCTVYLKEIEPALQPPYFSLLNVM